MFHVTASDRTLQIVREGLCGTEQEGPFTDYLDENELPRGNYLFGNLEDALTWAVNTYGEDHAIFQVDVQGLSVQRDPEQVFLESQDDPVDPSDQDRWLVISAVASHRVRLLRPVEVKEALEPA